MKMKKTRPTVEDLRWEDGCSAIGLAFFLTLVVDVLWTLVS